MLAIIFLDAIEICLMSVFLVSKKTGLPFLMNISYPSGVYNITEFFAWVIDIFSIVSISPSAVIYYNPNDVRKIKPLL